MLPSMAPYSCAPLIQESTDRFVNPPSLYLQTVACCIHGMSCSQDLKDTPDRQLKDISLPEHLSAEEGPEEVEHQVHATLQESSSQPCV